MLTCLFTKNAQNLVPLNAAEIKQQEIQLLCPWGQDSFYLALSPKDLSLTFVKSCILNVCSHRVLKCFFLHFSAFSLVSLRDRYIHFYQAMSPQCACLRKALKLPLYWEVLCFQWVPLLFQLSNSIDTLAIHTHIY